jgi:hypothetical protein
MTAHDDFAAYFNVADEIFESISRRLDQSKPTPFGWGLTLADLDTRYVEAARRASSDLDLPWPPYLPAAEEYALDHPEAR